MRANNPPTDYERVAVNIGREDKIGLIHYAAKRQESVSDVVRKLISDLLKRQK